MGSSKLRLVTFAGLVAVTVTVVIVVALVGSDSGEPAESPPLAMPQLSSSSVSPQSESEAAETTVRSTTVTTESGEGTTTPYTGTASPVAVSFVQSVSQGPAPLVVSFSATATTDSGGQLSDYEWTFGDGLQATGPEVAHVYQASGPYEVRLTVTDSKGFSAASRNQVLVSENGGPGSELVDYVSDPGFENGDNGFEDYYEISTIELTTIRPIAGSTSLIAHLLSWSDVILPVTYPYREGPNGYSLAATAEVRVESATPETAAELCAVAYWNVDDQEVRYEECTKISGTDRGVQVITAVLELDPHERLGRVYFWLSYPQDGDATLVIDNAHLILDKVPG